MYEGIRNINHFTDRPVAWLTARSLPMMSLGLMRASIELCLVRKKYYAFGMIEPFMLDILSGLHITFESIGPMVNYLNVRQPVLLDSKAVLSNTKKYRPDVYSILSDNGRLWELL